MNQCLPWNDPMIQKYDIKSPILHCTSERLTKAWIQQFPVLLCYNSAVLELLGGVGSFCSFSLMESQQLLNKTASFTPECLHHLHFFKNQNIWSTSVCLGEAICTILVFNLPRLPLKALLGFVIYSVFGVNLQKSKLAANATEMC